MDKQLYDQLKLYAQAGLEKGYPAKLIQERLTQAGHPTKLVKQVLTDAQQDIQQYAPPEVQESVKKTINLGAAVPVIVVILLGLSIILFSNSSITGNFLIQNDLTCANAQLEMLTVDDTPGVCTMRIGDLTTVQVMVKNKGADLDGYSLIINGQQDFDRYTYTFPVEHNELIAKVIDFDNSKKGDVQSVRVIPYVEGQQCGYWTIKELDSCI